MWGADVLNNTGGENFRGPTQRPPAPRASELCACYGRLAANSCRARAAGRTRHSRGRLGRNGGGGWGHDASDDRDTSGTLSSRAESLMATSYASIFRSGLFTGQVVVVTGGGSGIGRCTAHELACLGAKIALIGRKLEKLEVVRAEIAAAGGEAERWVCDIREENTVKETIAAVLARFSRIDGLVNNAGGQFAAPLAQITQKGWETVVRTNLSGGFLMARETYTQWMAENGGAIVNIVADIELGVPLMGLRQAPGP